MPAKGMTADPYLLSRGWRRAKQHRYYIDHKGRIFVRQQAVTIQKNRDNRCLSLPKFPHNKRDQCDPFCGACTDVLEECGKRAEAVIDVGFAAFWRIVSAHFPQLEGPPPSFTELQTTQMRADAIAAIQDWLWDVATAGTRGYYE